MAIHPVFVHFHTGILSAAAAVNLLIPYAAPITTIPSPIAAPK